MMAKKIGSWLKALIVSALFLGTLVLMVADFRCSTITACGSQDYVAASVVAALAYVGVIGLCYFAFPAMFCDKPVQTASTKPEDTRVFNDTFWYLLMTVWSIMCIALLVMMFV